MVECLPHDDGARNRDHHREPKVYSEYDYRFGGMIVEHKLDPLDTPKNQQRVLHALRGTRKTSKLLCAYSKVFVYAYLAGPNGTRLSQWRPVSRYQGH